MRLLTASANALNTTRSINTAPESTLTGSEIIHLQNIMSVRKKVETLMTKHEKIVVSAYTGVLMCDFDDLHKYIQEKLGRPVWTHELAAESVWAEIKEKSKEDFLAICQHDDGDLISRSALLKEVGDPDDGMVWPSKHGVIDLIKNAPAI